jgi:hypothetical protein
VDATGADLPADNTSIEAVALDGAAGTPGWTWRGGDRTDRERPKDVTLRLADLDGTSRRSV